VTITQKGLDLLIELEPKVKIHEESYSQKLSEEERLQLNELLEKFRNQ
jgi:DNA-binding MarR family transcriptional regulator